MNTNFRSIISGIGIAAGVIGAGWAIFKWREPIVDEISYQTNNLLDNVGSLGDEAIDTVGYMYDDAISVVEGNYSEKRREALETITPGVRGRIKSWFYRISEQDQSVSSHLNGQVRVPETVDTSVIETIRNRRYGDDVADIVKGLSPEKEEERRKWRESFKKAQEAGELASE